MDDHCIQCNNPVRARQEGLQCDSCNRWQHRTCNTGITRDQYRQGVRDGGAIEWTCGDCAEPNAELQPEDEHADDAPTDQSLVIERPFDIPEPALEESIDDNANLGDIVPEEHTTQYHQIDSGSNRGKRKLVDSSGFNYTVKKQKNDHTIWRCIKRGKNSNCPATIIQDGDAYRQGAKNHIHAGDPGVHIAVRIKAEAKQAGRVAAFNQPSTEVVKNAMRNHADPAAPPASRPNPNYLVRSINRIRQGDRPKDPADLNSEVA